MTVLPLFFVFKNKEGSHVLKEITTQEETSQVGSFVTAFEI